MITSSYEALDKVDQNEFKVTGWFGAGCFQDYKRLFNRTHRQKHHKNNSFVTIVMKIQLKKKCLI